MTLEEYRKVPRCPLNPQGKANISLLTRSIAAEHFDISKSIDYARLGVLVRKRIEEYPPAQREGVVVNTSNMSRAIATMRRELGVKTPGVVPGRPGPGRRPKVSTTTVAPPDNNGQYISPVTNISPEEVKAAKALLEAVGSDVVRAKGMIELVAMVLGGK